MALQMRVPLGDMSNGLNQAKAKGLMAKPLDKRRRDSSPRRSRELPRDMRRASQGKAPVAKPRATREERSDNRRMQDGRGLRHRQKEMSMGLMGDGMLSMEPSMMPMEPSMVPMGYMQHDPSVYTEPFESFDAQGYPVCYAPVQPQFLEDNMTCAPVWSWDQVPCISDGMVGPDEDLVITRPRLTQPPHQPEAPHDGQALRKEGDKEVFVYPGHPAYNPIDVKVKNTFIDLPAPRTPSPNSMRVDKTPVPAKTCPPKVVMSEAARAQWEEARADAEEAAALFAGRDRDGPKAALAFDETTSVGSLLHRAGLCKPCAWFHHAKGCQRGVRCEFCHCCPPGEIKKRKKEKTVQIRKRRTEQHQHSYSYCADYAKAVPVVRQYEIPQCW